MTAGQWRALAIVMGVSAWILAIAGDGLVIAALAMSAIAWWRYVEEDRKGGR